VDEHDVEPDAMVALIAWLEDARARLPQADAMALATATPDGRPSVRIVLLRAVDERGLTFFTNRESRKGQDLRENPCAAGCLHWWELGRQVRVEGPVELLDDEESAAYWATRPRASRLAAWASRQSRPLASRVELLEAFAHEEERFAGAEVPLPPFWGGYRLRPDTVELWTHREDRLHDRIAYTRTAVGWNRVLLAP
jgi:pyridoxamine 5'-phosphate oxidase